MSQTGLQIRDISVARLEEPLLGRADVRLVVRLGQLHVNEPLHGFCPALDPGQARRILRVPRDDEKSTLGLGHHRIIGRLE